MTNGAPRPPLPDQAATARRIDRRRSWKVPALVLALALGTALAVAPVGVGVVGAAPVVSCGETITSGITLRANLTCGTFDGDALVIGGSNITVNLGGHTITGRSGFVGIAIEGSRVTVQGGTIRDAGDGVFAEDLYGDTLTGLTIETGDDGVDAGYAIGGSSVTFDHFSDLTDGILSSYTYGTTIADDTFGDAYYGVATEDVEGTAIRGNMMTDVEEGADIEFASSGTSIATNRITGSSYEKDGIMIDYGEGVSVSTNEVEYFGTDIYLGDVATASVANNRTYSAYRGIYSGFGSGATFTHDASQGDDDGMFVYDPSHVSIVGCTFSYNFQGLYVENYEYRPGATVARTTASHNTEYGFYAVYPVAGSRNVTRGNGSPAYNVPM
jgi:hypothetical protein